MSSSIVAQLSLIGSGAGIGVLPTYLTRTEQGIVRVLDELREKRDTAREAIRRRDTAPAELSFGEDVLAPFADLMRNKT